MKTMNSGLLELLEAKQAWLTIQLVSLCHIINHIVVDYYPEVCV